MPVKRLSVRKMREILRLKHECGQTNRLNEYAKKKISIHSCGWVVVEGVFLRLEHR